MTLEEIFVRMFNCDAARIVNPLGVQMFLIIGHKRSTKDDTGQWYRNGAPYDFEYLKEQVIASGRTVKELWESARTYKRLQRFGSMVDLLEEQTKRRRVVRYIPAEDSAGRPAGKE